MKLNIQEHDFDFRKHIHHTLYLKEHKKTLYMTAITVLLGLTLLCSGVIMVTPTQHSFQPTNQEIAMAQPISAFKAISPASAKLIENSLTNVFSLSSAIYTDKSSVRIVNLDDQLDKVQGDLLKQIRNDINMKDVNVVMGIDSHLNKISVVSFDPATQTMVAEINYAINLKYKNKSNIEVDSPTSVNKQLVKIILDSNLQIKEFQLLKDDTNDFDYMNPSNVNQVYL